MFIIQRQIRDRFCTYAYALRGNFLISDLNHVVNRFSHFVQSFAQMQKTHLGEPVLFSVER
jgi:hypothetical protein